jgi:hypothetical protein
MPRAACLGISKATTSLLAVDSALGIVITNLCDLPAVETLVQNWMISRNARFFNPWFLFVIEYLAWSDPNCLKKMEG